MIAFILWMTACKMQTSTPSYSEETFNGEKALELIQEQMAFGDRIPGSTAHQLTGDWIVEELKRLDWAVEEKFFSYREFEGRNIIGKAGPQGAEWILLGAHYDTRPVSDWDEENPTTPVPGANDGGSGVAVLLELARVLQSNDSEKQIWLVFFDLEDSGGIDGMDWIVGSTYFAEHLDAYPDQVVIVDMVGDADLQLYYE
jgi:glutaminyl-peptide cyclotransferase